MPRDCKPLPKTKNKASEKSLLYYSMDILTKLNFTRSKTLRERSHKVTKLCRWDDSRMNEALETATSPAERIRFTKMIKEVNDILPDPMAIPISATVSALHHITCSVQRQYENVYKTSYRCVIDPISNHCDDASSVQGLGCNDTLSPAGYCSLGAFALENRNLFRLSVR